MSPLPGMQGPTLGAGRVLPIWLYNRFPSFRDSEGLPFPVMGCQRFLFGKRRDFLVDNSDQRSYAWPKHKKAIYLLALPSGLPSERGRHRPTLFWGSGVSGGRRFAYVHGRMDFEGTSDTVAAVFTKTAL